MTSRIVHSAAITMMMGISGCGSSGGQSSNTPILQESEVIETAANAASSPSPAPNFDQEERGTYYYVAAVSEEEQKTGKSAGDVLGFRYFGKNDKGEHILAVVASDNSVIGRSYCADPCKVIRQENRRIGFNPDSIIGAAFSDAMAGYLKPYKNTDGKNRQNYPMYVSYVPDSFLGAWDELVSDKCRNREPRYIIESKKFYNFESEYDVTGVKLYSSTEADIETTYKDESANQQTAVWELRLTADGDALTDRRRSETFFHRCPKS